LEIVVEAGQRDRVDALVALPLSAQSIADAAGRGLRLIETTGGKEGVVGIQYDDRGARLWWLAEGSMPAGAKRSYRLQAATPVALPGVTMVDTAQAVEARIGDKPLLRYSKAHIEAPAGANPLYGRSAHLHPVWTPSGAVVTDEFPPDHLHQSGIFLAHTKAKFEDRDVDFWNLAGGKGRVRFKELKGLVSGPVFGELRTEHEHVDYTAAADKESDPKTGGKVALLETWEVRVWNLGSKSNYWLLDITSTSKCATDSPLQLPEYHYGGMAIRAARPWTPQHVQFLTSEGKDRIQGNHTRARWCEVSGLIGDRAAGVLLMTHPDNFRFPEPLRIHPTMPYMVYTPSFLGDWEIRPGTTHQSRYRFVIHDGEMPAETAERLWQDFAEPLVAKVK
jgi:hypothetical protein